MTMAELLAEYPAAGQVLARRGMACVGCTMAPFETLGEAAVAYAADPGELLQEVTAITRRVPPRVRSRRSPGSREKR